MVRDGLRMHSLVFVSVTVTAVLWLTAAVGRAQQEEVAKAGRPTYEQDCAVCHGREGKGDGGASNLLTVKPADLTQLSKNNNGAFPFWRVYGVIDGRQEVKGHGTREMPFWGAEFRAEAGTNPAAQSLVRGRILELVYYLESIQAQ
jgi:mono/diheme cytochrome c family protein